MSLVWPDDPEAIVPNEPRLHALVIGVARYPHLLDGDGPPAADQFGLRQVTTPDYTARAVVEWLTTGYTNPGCKLGSVEFLLSTNSPCGVSVGPATMDNIEKAVAAWLNRASRNPSNIAFLYYCGHGLEKEDLYLLPEDFGDPQYPSRWRNCIDFDGFRVGLRSACKAETQVMFIDACRETPFGMFTKVNVEGRSLIDGEGFGSTVKSQAVYYATAEGQQAYGPENDTTFFGKAVLSCFDGLASANTHGSWVVDTHALGAALQPVMEYLGEVHNQPLRSAQSVSGRTAVLHRPPRPRVLARIKCSTDEATAAAEIVLQRLTESYQAGLGDRKPLVKEVDPGDWRVTVNFPNGEYPPSGPLLYTLMPPTFNGVTYP